MYAYGWKEAVLLFLTTVESSRPLLPYLHRLGCLIGFSNDGGDNSPFNALDKGSSGIFLEVLQVVIYRYITGLFLIFLYFTEKNRWQLFPQYWILVTALLRTGIQLRELPPSAYVPSDLIAVAEDPGAVPSGSDRWILFIYLPKLFATFPLVYLRRSLSDYFYVTSLHALKIFRSFCPNALCRVVDRVLSSGIYKRVEVFSALVFHCLITILRLHSRVLRQLWRLLITGVNPTTCWNLIARMTSLLAYCNIPCLLVSLLFCYLAPVSALPEPEGTWGCGAEEIILTTGFNIPSVISKSQGVADKMTGSTTNFGSGKGSLLSQGFNVVFSSLPEDTPNKAQWGAVIGSRTRSDSDNKVPEGVQSSPGISFLASFLQVKDQNKALGPPRSFRAMAFYPIDKHRHRGEARVPWMHSRDLKGLAVALALPILLLQYLQRIITQAVLLAPLSRRRRRYPLVLVSPGVVMGRAGLTSICQALASQGSVVVVLEHSDGTALTSSGTGGGVGGTPIRVCNEKLSLSRFRDRIRSITTPEADALGKTPGSTKIIPLSDRSEREEAVVAQDVDALLKLITSSEKTLSDSAETALSSSTVEAAFEQPPSNKHSCLESGINTRLDATDSPKIYDSSGTTRGTSLLPAVPAETARRTRQLRTRVQEILAAYFSLRRISSSRGSWLKDRLDWSSVSLLGFGFGGAAALITVLLDHLVRLERDLACVAPATARFSGTYGAETLPLSLQPSSGSATSNSVSNGPTSPHRKLEGKDVRERGYLTKVASNVQPVSSAVSSSDGITPDSKNTFFSSCILLAPWLDPIDPSFLQLAEIIAALLPEYVGAALVDASKLRHNFLVVTAPTTEPPSKPTNQFKLVQILRECMGYRALVKMNRCTTLDLTDYALVWKNAARILRISGPRDPYRTNLMAARILNNFLAYIYRRSLFSLWTKTSPGRSRHRSTRLYLSGPGSDTDHVLYSGGVSSDATSVTATEASQSKGSRGDAPHIRASLQSDGSTRRRRKAGDSMASMGTGTAPEHEPRNTNKKSYIQGNMLHALQLLGVPDQYVKQLVFGAPSIARRLNLALSTPTATDLDLTDGLVTFADAVDECRKNGTAVEVCYF